MSDGVTINRIAGLVGEALIMTGVGLAVAIPAVLAYKGSSQKMENKAR
jgi:biopolymer transport protein ExbB